MGRPKGSKNKPKVAATPVAPESVVKESKKIAKGTKKAKAESSVVNVAETTVATTAPAAPVVEKPKVDWTPLTKLVKAVYDILPEEQQLKWQQPSEDPGLKTPEDKITAVLAVYFGLDGSKVQNLK